MLVFTLANGPPFTQECTSSISLSTTVKTIQKYVATWKTLLSTSSPFSIQMATSTRELIRPTREPECGASPGQQKRAPSTAYPTLVVKVSI
ncbi:hypothetical protein COOONC_00424 [Cooperia oncophora]